MALAPPGNALAAAQGATHAAETIIRYGGADDPLARKYRQVRAMGKGGADGAMYRAIVVAGVLEGQMHALKYRMPGDDPQREIETLRAVSHPNIVKLLEVFEPHRGRRSTVLAFLESDSDLGDFLRRRAGLGSEERLSDTTRHGIALQLLSALQHVHERGLIHRDVKPGNILVHFGEPLETCRTPSGEHIACFLRVRLADFSRARWLPSSSAGTQRKRRKTTVDKQGRPVAREEVMSTRVSTPNYVAPEVPLLSVWERETETQYGTAIDIWAFGAVLFQVLSEEHFVPEPDGDIKKVICWIISRIGANVAETAASALLSLPEQFPATPLAEYHGNGWPWVKAALVWEVAARPSARQLAREPWAVSETVGVGGGGEEAPVGNAPAAARGGGGESAPRCTLGRLSDPCAPEPTRTKKSKKCACSGHCYQPGHRYRSGCEEKAVVAYSNYCLACKCVVPGCARPRLRGVRCHSHKAVWVDLPLELRATSVIRNHVSQIFPCDGTDFISRFLVVGFDFLWTTTVALFKEPAAIAAMEGTGAFTRPATKESLTKAFDAALAAVDEAPHATQLESLNRQGIARFQGVASTLCHWGYVEIREDSTRKRAPKQSLAVAQGPPNRSVGNSYYVRPTESPEAAVQQLLTARDAVQKEWSELLDGDTDALAIVRKVRVVLSKAAKAAPRIFPHDDTAYVATSVVRKVVLAVLSSGRATADWASMRRAELEELCCDQNKLLKTLPETWSAADISNFIFGRPDWAIFVSLFGCLLRDAIKIPKVSSDDLLECLASPIFGETAEALRAQCGHAVHPAIVLKELRSQGHC